jgi:Flp pilus assembly protein TadD
VRRIAALVALLLLAGCSHLVLLHDPLSAPEHTDLGVAYETAGQDALARREYHKALALAPHLAQPRINLGNLAAKGGRWKEAEKHYRRALVDAPADPDARNNLAYVLVRSHRRLDEAEALALAAVATGGARDSVYRSTLAEVRAARRAPP